MEISTALANIEKKLPDYKLPTEISTAEEYKSATDTGGKIKKAYKDIEKYMKFYSDPHFKEYKRIREQFAPFLSTLKEKETALKSVMLVFHKAEQVRKDAEQKALEAAALENASEGDEVTVPVVNNIATTEATYGKSQVRTLKRWKVTDITLVPHEYLEVNKKAVDAAIKKGITVPGTEQYEEQSMAFSG